MHNYILLYISDLHNNKKAKFGQWIYWKASETQRFGTTDTSEWSISDDGITVGTVVFYGQIVEITSVISVWACDNLEPATFSLDHI